jgi:hypothetical protein
MVTVVVQHAWRSRSHRQMRLQPNEYKNKTARPIQKHKAPQGLASSRTTEPLSGPLTRLGLDLHLALVVGQPGKSERRGGGGQEPNIPNRTPTRDTKHCRAKTTCTTYSQQMSPFARVCAPWACRMSLDTNADHCLGKAGVRDKEARGGG